MSTTTHMTDFISNNLNNNISLNKFYRTLLTVDSEDLSTINRIPYDDFFTRYTGPLSQITVQYIVLPEYFYQPKTVSQMIYGTTELWLGLLRLNKMRNITEFNQDIISIYEPAQLSSLIKIFFNREKIF